MARGGNRRSPYPELGCSPASSRALLFVSIATSESRFDMRRLRLTHALTAVALLALCWTWVDAREQTAAQPRPAAPAPAKPAPAKPVAASPAPTQSHKATLDRYCVTCHSDRLKTAGLTLESIDTTNIAGAPDVWEKVVRKVRVGMMPPQGRPQPDRRIARARSCRG